MPQRKIIEIDEDLCNGCGQCMPNCAEGALELVNGKAKLVKDIYCDGLGACLGHCPTGALQIIERDAPEFDEHAAMAYVRQKEAQPPKPLHSQGSPCGCPGSALRQFKPAAAPAAEGQAGACASQLRHWPIKLKLAPPTAPFFKNADLLIAADCVPGAMPDFHASLLAGHALVTTCPKFGDTEESYEKLKEIFQYSGLRSVTVADMEVPCCSALPAMARQAMEETGCNVPFHDIVIGLNGAVLRRE
ncbi:MAG: 4Fe-4S binding protein [Desulfovibrionaceae bacterium]|nr:4Fe-4S binding protein [Desulfovibrionaceae bacterium]MBF0515298.1 4Fe-4S binding protein [Desulfovibrionaceae bacterium]